MLAKDSKESLVAPNLDKLLQQGQKLIEDEHFFEKNLGLLAQPSSRDLAYGLLCNLALHAPGFKGVLAKNKALIVEAIAKRIGPHEWKTGPINLLCNLIGKEAGGAKGEGEFTPLAIEHCLRLRRR